MDKLFSQIIALTKNINLVKLTEENHGEEQFFAGKREPFTIGGFGVIWWHTKLTHSLIENISFMIIKDTVEFYECDYKSIQQIIKETFHEICVDKKLFNGDHVCFAMKNTLFDCRIENKMNEYAKYILESIKHNIRKSISDWCIVYAAPKITGKSFSIEQEGIKVIHKQDREQWNELIESGYPVNRLNQETGIFLDGRNSTFTSSNYDYLFVCLSHGTIEGSKFSSALKLRKLFSVIYAASNAENNKARHKVTAKPNSYAIHIPHNSSSIDSISKSTIGELLPYYAEDNILNQNTIINIQRWYEAELKLEPDQKNRINKCAHFINKGMNSNDIESYIHFFVALDALYGIRGNVKQSITKGISDLPQKDKWSEKFSWLFDLRNELVHGGSRYIQEWPKYMKYYNHFSTEPDKDIEQLALLALIESPSIMNKPKNSIKTKES